MHFGVFAVPEMYILGDLEKPTVDQRLAHQPHYCDGETITLLGARDEVVAFQVVLRADRPEKGLHVRLDWLRHEAGGGELITPWEIQPFLAHYVETKDASYSWGPGGAGALPWRGEQWPDALVPFYDPYQPTHPVVIDTFAIDPARHRNQIVWFDVFVPRDAQPGLYRGELMLEQNGAIVKTLPVRLKVLDWALPAEPTVEVWTEVYRETGVMFDSGVKFKVDPERDWHFYKRYVQMGHAHRILVTHRAENGPLPRTPEGEPAAHWSDKWGEDWSMYLPSTVPILDGSLFTAEEGYIGPRAGVGPKIFPAPIPEAFYGAKSLLSYLEQHGGKLPDELLATWKSNAEKLAAEFEAAGIDDREIRLIGYVFDEVDGITDDGKTGGELEKIFAAYLKSAEAFATQKFDLDLIWTTHRPVEQWPGLDSHPDTVWTPNAHALNPEAIAPHLNRGDLNSYGSANVFGRLGDRLWFYHSGHPAIGNHTINQLGIDMALWGLMPMRYETVNGAFMWSSMNFPERWDKEGFNPYDNPSYRADDTRWGNGTLIYPGSRLTMIGAARNIEGPIPSMRLKAWRSGLQMAEYVARARSGAKATEADAKLKALIPAGFAEAGGKGRGTWGQDSSDYYAFREWLAGIGE